MNKRAQTHTPNKWHSFMASRSTKLIQHHAKGSSCVRAIYLKQQDWSWKELCNQAFGSLKLTVSEWKKQNRHGSRCILCSLWAFMQILRRFTCWHCHTQRSVKTTAHHCVFFLASCVHTKQHSNNKRCLLHQARLNQTQHWLVKQMHAAPLKSEWFFFQISQYLS